MTVNYPGNFCVPVLLQRVAFDAQLDESVIVVDGGHVSTTFSRPHQCDGINGFRIAIRVTLGRNQYPRANEPSLTSNRRTKRTPDFSCCPWCIVPIDARCGGSLQSFISMKCGRQCMKRNFVDIAVECESVSRPRFSIRQHA